MTPEQFIVHLKDCNNDIVENASKIIANTALETSKETFRDKKFNGVPWTPNKKKKERGSLMISSGKLLNSIRITKKTKRKITISAGNSKVPYAKVHNEGGKAGRGKGFTMPKRQFLGDSKKLTNAITKRLTTYLKNKL